MLKNKAAVERSPLVEVSPNYTHPEVQEKGAEGSREKTYGLGLKIKFPQDPHRKLFTMSMMCFLSDSLRSLKKYGHKPNSPKTHFRELWPAAPR